MQEAKRSEDLMPFTCFINSPKPSRQTMRYFKSCRCLDDNNAPSPSQSASVDLDSAPFAGIQACPFSFLHSPESNQPF
ncbi:hypothetical protein EMPG_17439 [Blastomyces silverae]|uniref:Uncharacterized protein n=1 Tax=Blastomyces silverae TaxID=2060906 RepID=A0A0H1B7J9_9EURO|nr:hypothetical protein EMPG_17439 [Blastomyces silverae]